MTSRAFRDPSALKDESAGFVVTEGGLGRTEDLALLTLRRALESYCSTYPAMMNRLGVFDPKKTVEQAEVVSAHGLAYVEAAFETIIHFQHFAEIVVKKILGSVHPLLPVSQSGGRHHVLIYDLLLTGKAPPEQVESLQWMEFSDALARVCALLDAQRIDEKAFGFVEQFRPALTVVNNLRNRLLHRGRFVLKYDALDELVAGYLLPFTLAATKLPGYVSVPYWQPGKLHCGLDPLAEIVSTGAYDLRRIAFFKALALAAYKNPLKSAMVLWVDEVGRVKEQAEEAAKFEMSGGGEVRECPVCGVESLVLHENQDSEEDPDTGETTNWWAHLFMAKCSCCGFEINDYLGEPSAYGLKVPDYWLHQEY